MAPAMVAAPSTLGPLTGPRGNFQLDPDRDRADARRSVVEQTIFDREPTLGHRKKLPPGKSEPAPAPVGPSYMLLFPILLGLPQ
jgi:hypothetical protein